MKFPRAILLSIGFLILSPLFFASASTSTAKTKAKQKPAAAKETVNMPAVDALIQEQINSEAITGAVLAVGHDGHLVHQKAFGFRALSPRREPMTLDTVFDLASLTKVVATTPSVMRLVQYGQVRLDDPVARYIPEFAANGKDVVNVRQLLTHFSGLKPDLDLSVPWEGREAGFHMANNEKLQSPAGAQFVYSDINFVVLQELVEQISGMPLDKYAEAHIFQPLGMKRTRFVPPPAWHAKIAANLGINNHQVLRGTVQDPTAQRIGGVAGDAGLFSTAGDLALYAQALIDRKKILVPDLIEKMTTPQQPPNAVEVRGLGWDIDSPFSSNRGALLPVGSFGHTGYTGTSIWIDPYSNTYIILLTNSVRPRPANVPVVSLRARVATAVAAALNLDVTSPASERNLTITGYSELAASSRRVAARNGHVLTGIDVLERDNFVELKPQTPTPTPTATETATPTPTEPATPTPTPDHIPTIGVLTNQNGIDGKGNRTIDVLAAAPGIKLAAIFTPEHGIFGTLDTLNTENSVDSVTGIPVYTMYGSGDARKRPPIDVLKKLDAVLIDLQDAGARVWTYETTVGYMLEAAAEANIEIIVLDRPNPVNGSVVQGPLSQANVGAPFNNFHPIPIRHGMTLGELAQLYNGERKIGARLRVIPMQGWLRGDWFDSTGIVWINPSPNLRSVNEAALYPGVSIIEGTNVSVGRGTDTPFEVVGAPWIKPKEFADYLNSRLINGVRFVPVTFKPTSATYSGQVCGGVNLIVTDRNLLDSPQMGIELAGALRKLYPDNWKINLILALLANQQVFDAISAGNDPRDIAQSWQDDLDKFREVRSKYLLYK